MEKTIWKFELETKDRNIIQMPKDAEILCVQEQYGKPCIWALVDPNQEKETQHFEIFGTGHPVYCDMGVDRKYIGTYQLSNGALVFHVFDRSI